MKRIKTTKRFDRNYKIRISQDRKLKQDFLVALELFNQDSQDPLLRDHSLQSRMGQFRSFAINADYRIIYLIQHDCFLLMDIGTHQQVYFRK